MKKFIYSFTFIILFLPSVVFASACSMLKSEIEDKISKLEAMVVKNNCDFLFIAFPISLTC